MQLEVNKSYRCRNGAIVKIYAMTADGTAYGKDGPNGATITYNSYTGSVTNPNRSGYDILTPTPEEQLDQPELLFSFRTPSPEYSKTVSETELREHIKDALEGHTRSHRAEGILALAAERMIEFAKTKPPKLKLSVKSAESIRSQLAKMLMDVGLNPDRFLNKPERDIKPMCMPEPTSKQIAECAADELAQMLHHDLHINITPILLRLWLVERWDEVAKLAHKIHGSK